MSPSGKKSTGKVAAQTGGQAGNQAGKKNGGKTAGKTSAQSADKREKKSAAAKAAPSGKRAARTKKYSGKVARGPYIAAFVAGLLAATVCFWSIHQILSRDQRKDLRPEAFAVSSPVSAVQTMPRPKADAPTDFSRQAEGPKAALRKSADRASMERVLAGRAPTERAPFQPQLLPPVGNKTPDVPPGLSPKLPSDTNPPGSTDSDRANSTNDDTDKAVAEALLELQSLPHGERGKADPAGPEQAAPVYPARTRQEGEPARMVIVIDDLGANASALSRLLSLSYPVTCAFWPHAAHTRQGAAEAHSLGREILVHQPMEPLGYPKVQPGPGLLRAGMSADAISRQIVSAIARVPYAVGMNNHMGSRFTRNRQGVGAVLRALGQRGLFALDSVTHSGSVFAAEGKRLGVTSYHRNVFLDVTATRAAIIAELKRAERIALLTGQSVAIGHPLPATLDALKEWQRLRDPAVELVRLRDIRAD